MATTNLERIYEPEIMQALEADFGAYKGGELMESGGSKVMTFSSPGGVAMF